MPISSRLDPGDWVIATTSIGTVPRNAVGLVKGISGSQATVLFIGKNKLLTTDVDNIDFLDIHKTGKPIRAGKPFEKKICNICHVLKPMSDFDINQTDASGRKTTRPSCRDCRVEIDGAGMTPPESRRLDAVRPKEVFTCPICGKRSVVGVTANLVKDHDHVTGKGREWICDSCNTGLGRFKDDTELLQKAIDYLKKYHASPAA